MTLHCAIVRHAAHIPNISSSLLLGPEDLTTAVRIGLLVLTQRLPYFSCTHNYVSVATKHQLMRLLISKLSKSSLLLGSIFPKFPNLLVIKAVGMLLLLHAIILCPVLLHIQIFALSFLMFYSSFTAYSLQNTLVQACEHNGVQQHESTRTQE